MPEYWIGDPEAKTLVIRRLVTGRWSDPVSLGLRDTATTPLMPGVRVKLKDLYAE